MNRPYPPGPRKAVVGAAMHHMFGPYPGLAARLAELTGLVDAMATAAHAQYGVGLDLAALPEMAVNGGRAGDAAEVSEPLDGPVLDAFAACARRHRCYIVVPLYLVDGPGRYSNAAVLLDRDGAPVGTYRKAFAVVARGETEAEGGVTPGAAFPVFDTDFGRVGLQICYDMAVDDGWDALERQGAELIVWPSQWPGRVHAASRALRGRCFVLSSTWRHNASLHDPTGHRIAEIRQDGVFVERIDLDYALLGWQPPLRNGALVAETYGDRAGFRYSEGEDEGIFWSNDPSTPIGQMVRALDLETREDALARNRAALATLGGSPCA